MEETERTNTLESMVHNQVKMMEWQFNVAEMYIIVKLSNVIQHWGSKQREIIKQ